MKKLLFVILLAISFCYLMASVSSHEPIIRKPIVISEPLPCDIVDQKLICFDGDPIEATVCKDLADNTVLCSIRGR